MPQYFFKKNLCQQNLPLKQGVTFHWGWPLKGSNIALFFVMNDLNENKLLYILLSLTSCFVWDKDLTYVCLYRVWDITQVVNIMLKINKREQKWLISMFWLNHQTELLLSNVKNVCHRKKAEPLFSPQEIKEMWWPQFWTYRICDLPEKYNGHVWSIVSL